MHDLNLKFYLFFLDDFFFSFSCSDFFFFFRIMCADDVLHVLLECGVEFVK